MTMPFLKDGPLRLRRPAPPAAPVAVPRHESYIGEPLPPPAPAPAPAAEEEPPYLARLVLLAPAEVISFHALLKPAAVNFQPWFGLICLVLVFLVRMKATAVGGKPEWRSVWISTGSFALWLYATGGSLPGLPPPADAGIISVAVGVWTFVIPYIYTGAPPDPASENARRS